MNLSTHKKSEVDLRVAQELKNNQDFIYQTNQSLQELRNEIFSLNSQYEKAIAKYESRQKEIEIGFENMKEMVDEVLHKCIQDLGDVKTEVNNTCKEVRNDLLRLTQECVTQTAFEYTVDSLVDAGFDHGTQIVKLQNDLKVIEANTRSFFTQELKSLRQDLTPIVPEIDPVQVKIDEVKKVVKVDLDGVAKEIFLMKKAIVYEQKKIENIYTLIERIKAGKK